MKYLRWLLLPFSLLYGLVVLIRNWLYDAGLKKSYSFNLPVISVGNLAVGGAGKSPMTEYLIRLLKPDYKLATLSRGYGRSTKGYVVAAGGTTATQIGDEPAQFKHKFPEITVAVCEKRVAGIEQLQAYHEVIILDDAFQHRAVKPGLSMVLFDYYTLQGPQFLLPAGNLREPLSGAWRADIIVITKCPAQLSGEEQARLAAKVRPIPEQPVFFTTIGYLPLQQADGRAASRQIGNQTEVFLLTGIARPQPLLDYLHNLSSHIHHHNYPDHHQFTLKNLTKLATAFNACSANDKVVITTEKDMQRLNTPELKSILSTLPVLVIPIGVDFLKDQDMFDQLIINYVREHRKNR